MIDFNKFLIKKDASIKKALICLENLSDDVLTLFVMDNKRLIGTLTDGDIRRALIRNTSVDTSVEQIMNVDFKFISPNEKDTSKIKKIKNLGVQLLPCLNEQRELLYVYNLKEQKSILPIDVVLMAGGKGERLRPLTENCPKPLLKVGGKSIIDYNVDSLLSYGVKDIYVTTNYLAEQIEEHYSEEHKGVKITCVREKEYYGTIASVKLIPSLKHDEVLIMNSDLFTNINFEDFYNFFGEKDADMLVAAIPYSINIPYGIFDLEEQNIIGIKEKPVHSYYANAGIYLIKQHLLDLIPEKSFFNATDFIELLIKKEKTVIRYPLVGYWIDIGKPEDYKKAQEFAKHISNDK
jgi:Nucleoside-diphosphate-sugar pyrophosphorylase involved in lipopolysaccharide biosynthesis/translation initiation factor 2B, gamma/epsilon subunits (eIF-2Bgamma/eIF-2Bepsilon)